MFLLEKAPTETDEKSAGQTALNTPVTQSMLEMIVTPPANMNDDTDEEVSNTRGKKVSDVVGDGTESIGTHWVKVGDMVPEEDSMVSIPVPIVHYLSSPTIVFTGPDMSGTSSDETPGEDNDDDDFEMGPGEPSWHAALNAVVSTAVTVQPPTSTIVTRVQDQGHQIRAANAVECRPQRQVSSGRARGERSRPAPGPRAARIPGNPGLAAPTRRQNIICTAPSPIHSTIIDYVTLTNGNTDDPTPPTLTPRPVRKSDHPIPGGPSPAHALKRKIKAVGETVGRLAKKMLGGGKGEKRGKQRG